VANTLIFLGYQPTWQDIFGTESGDLRSLLRQQIDHCKGVVQLVGQCYGSEPPSPDEEFGRISYTQYEALYARKCGKKVWYLFMDETFPVDSRQWESEEITELQSAYRRGLQSDTYVFHPVVSSEGLETSVLKLRDDLAPLRRTVKQWAAGVAILLIVITASLVWLLRDHHQDHQRAGQTKKAVAELTAEIARMRLILLEYPRIAARARRSQLEGGTAVEEQAYAELGRLHNLDPGLLREKLPQLAEQMKEAQDVSRYERANAAYISKDYQEAERLALAAADDSRKAIPPRIVDAIRALQLAAWSAEARIGYADALKHLREAEKLTERTHDPLEWARVQGSIAQVLDEQGRYYEAENILREVVEEETRALGSEHADTLRTRTNLAVALVMQGKYLEAEEENRIVLESREKVSGPEHPDTLNARHVLGVVLARQGKYAEAANEDRAVLKLREKVLGPEHPDTLDTRCNLAMDILAQGEYSEAEADFRAILKLREKMQGPIHPDTLRVRNEIGMALLAQGKYSEAETEERAVLKLSEEVLGSEHPDTLNACYCLALVLKDQGKVREAETFARQAAEATHQVLGPDNPDTRKYTELWLDLQSRN
jgi:tetratricopeptide (TPR) repeat protein